MAALEEMERIIKIERSKNKDTIIKGRVLIEDYSIHSEVNFNEFQF